MGALRTTKRSMAQFLTGERSKINNLGHFTRQFFKASEFDKHIQIKVKKSIKK